MQTLVNDIVRVHWNVHKSQYTIREQTPDRKGRPYWKNKAYRASLVLREVHPHFYRGTQRKVQKGEMEKTPFAFLEGEWLDPSEINWDQYKPHGVLEFDPDRDRDFTWNSPLGKIIVSPENGLPEGAILYFSHVGEDEPEPCQEVYLPKN